jgi:hypothetical protein
MKLNRGGQRVNRSGQPFGENKYLTRRASKEKPIVSAQKFTWKTIATYSTYKEADRDRCSRMVGGAKLLKVKRRANCFEVRMGTPI